MLSGLKPSINHLPTQSDMNRNDVVADFSSMDLNLLKVFEALFEEGGASRAAIRLGLTQSAVSAALGRLRRLYADHLFERTGRGLKPTAKAQALRPLVGEALDRCRDSLALARPGTDLEGRTLTLGLSDDYEIALGARLIQALRLRAPGLRLILRQTHSLVAGDMLMDREIDLSLTAGGVSSRTLGRRILGSGGYACLVDPACSPAGPFDLAAFLARDHILISSGGFVGIVDEALAGRRLARRVRASTTHFAALPHLLLGSDSIATLPRHAAKALAAVCPLASLPCPLALPAFAVELGWRLDSLRDPAIGPLLAVVTEACKASLGLGGPEADAQAEAATP